jgi:hypothetical protein
VSIVSITSGRLALGILIAVSGTSPLRADSTCDIALRSNAFDTENSNSNLNIAMSKRQDLCNKDYSSLTEAESAVSAAGFNASYGAISLGGSKSSGSTSGRTSIKNTDFCNATNETFQKSLQQNYSKSIGSVALTTWLACIKETNSNALHLEYRITENGGGLIGTIRTRANDGSLKATITSFLADGGNIDLKKPKIRCSFDGATYFPEQVPKAGIDITKTEVAVTCFKMQDQDLYVTIRTTNKDFQQIFMPSSKVAATLAKDVTEKSRIAAAQRANEDAEGLKRALERIKALEDAQKDQAEKQEGAVKLFGKLKLICTGVTKPGRFAACPDDYKATGCSAGQNKASHKIRSGTMCETDQDVEWTSAHCCKVGVD